MHAKLNFPRNKHMAQITKIENSSQYTTLPSKGEKNILLMSMVTSLCPET